MIGCALVLIWVGVAASRPDAIEDHVGTGRAAMSASVPEELRPAGGQ
ncbi:MAG: hypothetical protein QM619_05045 [Micropruina sp.]